MHFSIKNKINEIQVAIDRLTELLSTHKIDQKDVNKVKIILDEAISNIIKYAFNDDQEANIKLIYNYDHPRLEIIIKDKGRAFNPTTIAEIIQKDHSDSKLGGLGILIMKELVDKLEYQREDKTNMLRITKLF